MLKRIKIKIQGARSNPPGLRGEESQQITVPIYYDDGKVIHACESCFMHAGAALVWTECDIAVPPGQSFTAADGAIEVTCPKCLATAP